MNRSTILAAAALSALSATAAPARPASGELDIGDRAPAIQVDRWVKGEPVQRFEPGTSYVVEFWATWCAPCKTSIPHLSKLQKEYPAVRFVGVSVWERDPSLVEPFVEGMGEKMAYAVAADRLFEEEGESRGAMAAAWMEASGSQSIPTAFIVDQKGRVAWIGHPMNMDEPLAKIAAGEWDIEAAARERREEAERAKLRDEVLAELQAAAGSEDWPAALAALDRAFAKQPKLEADLGTARLYVLMQTDLDQAFAYAAKLTGGVAADSAPMLNMIAWMIVDPENELARRDLDVALEAARRANELTKEEEPSILDTLARVHFLRGELQQAIELQRKAVELAAGRMKDQLKERLEEYEGARGTR